MTIKSILVPLDSSEKSLNVLDTALIVANRFDAKIKAVHVMPSKEDALPFELDYISAKLKKSVINEAAKKAVDEARVVQNKFESFCAKHKIKVGESFADGGVGAVWCEEFGDTLEVLIKHGMLCDVIATFRPRKTSGRLRRSPAGQTLEGLMMRAGRPILMVPPKWTARKVAHAAVAWNESPEAARALAMTMPWLQQMEQVSIIVSRKRKQGVPRLVEYLELHGVESKVRYLPAKAKSVGGAILDCCADNLVEFLVVGGFSHSRSKQLVFGGVTRHLLAHSNVITVMVH